MKTIKNKQFPVVVEMDEDGVYIAECPVFRGCYTQGKTLDEALENIKEVIELCLEEEENKEILKTYQFKNLSLHAITV
jgi:predicted RNase H-like HicB family nuclease